MAAVAHQATMHQHVIEHQGVIVENKLKTEIDEVVKEIETQLNGIMVRFRRIVRHIDKTNDYEYNDTLQQSDLKRLKTMYDELQQVASNYPYCSGCSGDEYMANQQAHTCMTTDDDNTDIDKAIKELIKAHEVSIEYN